MEIEEIKEVDEDQEVEKYENHNGGTNYELNRLETEYADDDEQAYDLYSIEEVFINYIWNSVSWIAFLILSMLALHSLVPTISPLLPLVLLELKYTVQSLKVLKEDYQIIESVFKSSHFVRTLDSLALLLAYGLMICWYFGTVQLFSYSVVSVSVIEVLRVFFKVHSPNGCVTFAGIVTHM